MKEITEARNVRRLVTRILLWLLVIVPPLVTLILVDQYRFKTPYLDGWAFVSQYFSIADNEQSLLHVLFERHNEHLVPIAKIFYFAALEFNGGAVGDLPYLTVIISMGIFATLCLLGRPQWNFDSPATGAKAIWTMLLASLAVFTTVQDYAWLWPFVFNNGLPFLWLTVGMLIWQRPGGTWARFTYTALIGLIAVVSFGNGFIVWPGLWLFIWIGACFENERNRKQVLIVWGIAAVVITVIVISGTESEGRLGYVASRPLLVAQYILALVGSGWSRGTPVEPRVLAMILGFLFCGTWAACVGHILIKRDRDLLRQAAPWIVLGGCSLAVAGMVCAARLSRSIDEALTGRYVTFCIYLSVSVLFLLPLVLKPKWTRLLIVLATLLITLQVANWNWGAHSMRHRNAMFLRKEACISFMGKLPWENLDPLLAERRWVEPVMPRLIKEDRIKRVFAIDNLELSGFRQGKELSESRAAFDSILRNSNGKLEAHGHARLKTREQPPELVILTWQTKEKGEMIFEIGLPNFPVDYFERSARRKKFQLHRVHQSHYNGWTAEMSFESLPKEKECIVRAYSYDYLKRQLYLMKGEFRIQDEKVLGKLE